MELKDVTSALAIATAMLLGATALTPAPVLAQGAKTITGGFDVGPGGLPGNFNPLAATAGFTWLSTYFEPLVIYNADLTKLGGRARRALRGQRRPAHLHLQARRREMARRRALHRRRREVHHRPRQERQDAARSSPPASARSPRSRRPTSTPSSSRSARRRASFLTDTLTKLMMLPAARARAIRGRRSSPRTPGGRPRRSAPAPSSSSSTSPTSTSSSPPSPTTAAARPRSTRLINRYFEDPAAAIAALRAGEIQFTYVELDDVTTFADDDAFRVIEGASYVVNYFGFNQQVPLWQDVRVRQAFMHAIDRNAIIDSLYGGAAVPANCVYVAEALVPAGIDDYAYDPEKAKALLEEAGWAEINGDKPIEVITYYGSPAVANVLAAIAGDARPGRHQHRAARRRHARPTTASSSRTKLRPVPDGLSPACRTAPTPATSTSA